MFLGCVGIWVSRSQFLFHHIMGSIFVQITGVLMKLKFTRERKLLYSWSQIEKRLKKTKQKRGAEYKYKLTIN